MCHYLTRLRQRETCCSWRHAGNGTKWPHSTVSNLTGTTSLIGRVPRLNLEVSLFLLLQAVPGSTLTGYPPFCRLCLLVPHAAEIAFVYGQVLPTDSASQSLSAVMMDYWISFTVSLTPNDGKGVEREDIFHKNSSPCLC